MSARPPITLPGYSVERVVGRGGQGIVLGGLDRRGAAVAIKILTTHAAPHDALARFKREQRLLSLLGEREGFVPILDAGESSAGPYFVMPFLAGGTLRDRLENKGALSVEETILLGTLVSRALGRAHERGIVHRDFKPENILFPRTREGGPDFERPLVADLGLAKHWSREFVGAGESLSLSKTGETRGTFGYMASEQIQDASRSVPASDVFSVGCVLYECLTGLGAFEGATPIEVVAKIESHELVALSKARPDAPAWLVEIIERSLSHDPLARFEDGEALALALEARGARSDERLERAQRQGRRVIAAVVGVALVIGGAAGGVLLRKTVRHHEGARIAATALERLEKALVVSRADVDHAIELAPESASAWTARAWLRANKGDVEGGVADATHAIGLDPSFARAWVIRGWMHETDPPNWKEARADFDRAIELDPNLEVAYESRCSARSALRDFAGAYADATKAIALKPTSAHMYASRAAFDRNVGRPDDQLTDSAHALELDKTFPEAWINHAAALIFRRDYKGAESDLTEALRLAPDHVEALANRSYARSMQGDVDGAIEDLTATLKLDPKRAGSYVERGVLQANRKRWALALEDGNRAVALDPNKSKAWSLVGWARLETNDLDGAEAAFTRALEITPRLSQCLAKRGLVRIKKNNYSGALEDVNLAIEIDPREREGLLARAFLHGEAHDIPGQVADYTALTALGPCSAGIWSDLGWGRASLKDWDGAIAALSKAIEVDPQFVPAYGRRAALREATQDFVGARADYEKCLDLAPDDEHAAEVREALRRLGSLR